MTDISIIITAHREGLISGITARSAKEAIEVVRKDGAETEVILVLDRSDDLTGTVLSNALASDAQVLETDLGDPGLARNAGVAKASGRFSAFLDGDDLWSINWLSEAWKLARARPDAVFHSHCNIIFGQERTIWWHIDSEGPLFDIDYLGWANYWDAMSFAASDSYRNIPFRANDLKRGFGHEDWHWNVHTIKAGIAHKPVPQTLHFKRRRAGSQMAQVAKNDAIIWPD